MTKHDEVHGEKQDRADAAAARYITRLGVAVERLDLWINEAPDDETFITGITIRVRYATVGDILGVVKARTPRGEEVAFHSGPTISDVLLGVSDRLDNRTLKWREDKPYGE